MRPGRRSAGVAGVVVLWVVLAVFSGPLTDCFRISSFSGFHDPGAPRMRGRTVPRPWYLVRLSSMPLCHSLAVVESCRGADHRAGVVESTVMSGLRPLAGSLGTTLTECPCFLSTSTSRF